MAKGEREEDKDFPIYYCVFCPNSFKTSVAKYKHMVKKHAKKYEESLLKKSTKGEGEKEEEMLETPWQRQLRKFGT